MTYITIEGGIVVVRDGWHDHEDDHHKESDHLDREPANHVDEADGEPVAGYGVGPAVVGARGHKSRF